VSTRVRVISLLNGLSDETEYAHGLIKLGSGTLIELDQYPATTRPRTVINDSLAPGMAIVSFAVSGAANDADLVWTAPALFPGVNASVATMRGATGELIELVANG
jgi:hypothetical protein